MKGFLGATFLIGAATLGLSTAPAFAAGPPQPLTSCNQDVEGDVYLTGDLDCTGIAFGEGVNLMKRATLELRGFSIRNAESYAVQCFKKCDVVGPGTLEGNFGGIWAPKKVDVVDVDLIDNGVLGIGTDKLTMTDSTVDGSRVGIFAGLRARLENSSVTGSAWTGISVSNTGVPPCTNGKVQLTNSTVTGNGLDAGSEECETRECVDIASCRKPRLDETSSCGTSLQNGGTESWQVCTLD